VARLATSSRSVKRATRVPFSPHKADGALSAHLEAWESMTTQVLVLPFTEETARAKVKAAEAAWNSCDPDRVSLAYTVDSQWRNRTEFFTGREAIREFLRRKWARETNYHLMKELWCFHENRISVRFEYEYQDAGTMKWMRAHGNEHWEFDEAGLMRRRDMRANDYEINEAERRYR
jgi:nuclear transport factor 2 (NTF2) superfamily protein